MTEPPVQPPHQPSGAPAENNPPTQPMSAAAGNSPATPPAEHSTNLWHQATSTHGGRWAIGIAAGALVCLMFLGIGLAGLAVLRNHNHFGMMGQRQDRFSRGQGGQLGQGNGRGMPGLPGGRTPGLGRLGSLVGGTALHGNVTATVNGSVLALVFQRGQVTSVSATSVTLKSTDGFVGTYGRTTATNSRTAAPVMGEQALVLARASDKVAITIVAAPANTGVAPSN